MQCISHKRDNQTNFAILQHETNDNKCNFDSKETKFGYILKIYFLSFAIHMRSKLTLIHCGPIFFFSRTNSTLVLSIRILIASLDTSQRREHFGSQTNMFRSSRNALSLNKLICNKNDTIIFNNIRPRVFDKSRFQHEQK